MPGIENKRICVYCKESIPSSVRRKKNICDKCKCILSLDEEELLILHPLHIKKSDLENNCEEESNLEKKGKEESYFGKKGKADTKEIATPKESNRRKSYRNSAWYYFSYICIILCLLIIVIKNLGGYTEEARYYGWGPERELFTMENRAPYITFNSITNNPVLGDERNFVRIAEKGVRGPFGDVAKLEPGKEYEIYIGYHNNAIEDLNNDGTGIAQQVRVATTFSKTVDRFAEGYVSTIISASNSVPEKIWDGVKVVSDEIVMLNFVSGSAHIYNGYGINESVLPSSFLTEDGTYIGVAKLDGIVYAGEAYTGHIIYDIAVEEYDEDKVLKENFEKPYKYYAFIYKMRFKKLAIFVLDIIEKYFYKLVVVTMVLAIVSWCMNLLSRKKNKND